MNLYRACSIALLIMPFGGRISLAQQVTEDLPLAERAYVASKIYSSLESYFAHRQGIADLDLDATYRAYLATALVAEGRRGFDLATLEYIARLRNKHTQFDDEWLRRNYGQPLGFGIASVEGKWAITWSQDDRLKKGDVVRAIDTIDIEAFVRDKQRFIAASSERAARSLVFDRTYLFPKRFTLELEGGRKIAIERGKPAEVPAKKEGGPPASEGRWVTEGSVGYIRIPGFNDPNFERTALGFIGKYWDSRCLVIDVRGNGGGSTPHELIRQLMDREWRDWTTSTLMSVALYRAQGSRVTQLRIESVRHKPQAGAFTGRLIILVDRFSCSACEDFVMPFKDNGRATIIGETTEGSSGQPYFFNFGNGMSIMVGAARYTFPNGEPFESVGVTPTISVDLRMEDVRAGIDSVFAKAKAVSGVP